MSITLTDRFNDTIDLNVDDGDVELSITEQDTTAEVWFADPSELLPLADAIYAEAGVDKPKRPAGKPDAVLASEVSFNEAVLRLAAAHQRPVTFRYAKGTGAVIETRTLTPGQVRNVDGHVTFTGFDPDRQAVRAYRSDRIKGEVSL